MGFFNDLYNNNSKAGLFLGLGLSLEGCNNNVSSTKHAYDDDDDDRKPSLTLRLSGGDDDDNDHQKIAKDVDDHSGLKSKVLVDQISGDLSAASSLISNAVSVKREREAAVGSDDLEIEKVSSRVGHGDDDGGDDDGSNGGRKKLRLTKAQSALLEESFKHHSTLNPKQKQELAGELKLRPRQVEVWFQNRRARTKLKQTEVDCELLKRCCDTLTEENRRLQKEVKELKALKLAQPPPPPPLYMQLPAAALTMCPSCERIGGGSGGGAAKGSLSLDLKPQLYNPSAC